ncbi:MAG: Ig-like domain-containing protein, partial [Cyclobacteriaceae bacterium]
MKYIFSLTFLSFVIIYFLTECASITPPGGGPRDTIPPVLIRSIPEHKSLNFSGNSVTLVYDEYLKIENLNKQLIITPIIQDDYEQKIRRNSIELIFPEPFKDSTTYTLNFQDAIQDITEGNVTEDNVLAFSTGDYIDSLYINGKVMELLTNAAVDDFTVCLYLIDDTLDIFNSPPIYLTKTDKEGKYLIENIKNGTYKLYVYDDANSNLTCDMPREMFGFSSDTIALNGNIDSIFLKVQNLDMRNIEIQRANASGKYFEIKTNKPLVDYSVIPMDTSITLYHNFVEDKKTIRFYNNLDDNDSIQFIFTAIDSLDYTFIDTL